MAKDTTKIDVGIKQCKDCEYYLKCEECSYRGFYRATVKEIIVAAYSKLAKAIIEDYPDMEYYLYGTIEELAGAE